MEPKERAEFKIILRVFLAFFSVMMLILVGKLCFLQIIDTDQYQLSAAKNRTRQISLPATRGDIITADGVVLATDQPVFEVVLNSQVLSAMKQEERTEILTLLAEILNDEDITVESIEALLKEYRYKRYQPIVLKSSVDMETVSKIEVRRLELVGVSIESSPKRTYLKGDIAAHLVGYIGEVNENEMKNDESLSLGDYIGKVGVERSYDNYLRGEEGIELVEVDVYNNAIGIIDTIEPTAGNNVILTIDYNLQSLMDQRFDEILEQLQKNPETDKATAGAAVLMEVKTGKVLAMSSRPSDKITQQNRAIQGRYIPGSTFKPVTLVAALEQGKVTTGEKIYNPGQYWEPPYIRTTAPIGYYDLYRATARSDNVFYQEMGRRVGIEGIGWAGEQLGLNGGTGIDLPYENMASRVTEGLPTEEKILAYNEWAAESKENYYNNLIEKAKEEYEEKRLTVTDEAQRKKMEKEYKNEIAQLEAQKKIDVKWVSEWHAADTYNVAIGQGRQNYTPLQLAVYCAALANGGTIYAPYVVDKVVDDAGNVLFQNETVVRMESEISERTFEIVRDAMVEVTENPTDGTAYWRFNDFPEWLTVAAKTGTSQPGQAGYKDGDKTYYDGIFIAYAPADDPQVVFAAVVEYGGSGSGSGGILCHDIFKEYFGLNQ